MKLVIYTDGASRGNPGLSSYGFIVQDAGGKLLHKEGRYIGITTNNVAEYSAVLQAFRYVLNHFKPALTTLNFYLDSRLVVEQLSGRFKIKKEHLKILFLQIRNLENAFKQVTYQHVVRAKNTLADRLANQALDARLKSAD
ncbi:hypothetical protein A3B45_02610 [Candidatus Daviesbacteria bacterium RIFCSPLOWO2_01_FULL_39_12]|uniref:RNase H type-1 domain-containing protein n=1 Tax=Candidatus Daviesbacteria bacterium RIFCSPLOWO2_01_FULL_39_12 TaxID=1797785 RepID=A0A1F5KSI2_9BACT|nr:MAG: hypothetical protein A3B45_02610 [Candidatus Daviesbacteria bacterium RIFCSPLOWO2_01_FULL_39_12]